MVLTCRARGRTSIVNNVVLSRRGLHVDPLGLPLRLLLLRSSVVAVDSNKHQGMAAPARANDVEANGVAALR